ncbi:MAG: hypothetical protein ACFFAE_04605 [Candidatus Hodarchaeota archaeon]
MEANEISKFKKIKLMDGHLIVIIASWDNNNGVDRLGEGVEAAREIFQDFNSKGIDMIIDRPFIGNLDDRSIIDHIQDIWKVSKGYGIRDMPLKSTIKTWEKIKTVNRDSKKVTEFYLRILD